MSMWLMLAKITPATLGALRDQPQVFEGIFGEDDPPVDFDPRTDLLCCDYRTLIAVAQARAATERGTDDWSAAYPWLGRAIGDALADGGEDLALEFTYGTAFAMPAHEVARVATGLAGEGWDFAGLIDEDESVADQPGVPLYDDFFHVLPFFQAASREGRAVVGGVD